VAPETYQIVAAVRGGTEDGVGAGFEAPEGLFDRLEGELRVVAADGRHHFEALGRGRQSVVETRAEVAVGLRDDLGSRRCRSVLKAHGLTVKRQPGYAANAFFVSAAEGTGLQIFKVAEYQNPDI